MQRSYWLLFLLMILILFEIPFAQNYGTLTFRADIGGPAVWDDLGTNKIEPGKKVAINIYCNNVGGDTKRITWSSPFNFTGSDGVTNVIWGDTALFPQGQFRTSAGFFDSYRRTYAESWDGILPDLFNYTGTAIFSGYYPNLGEIKFLACSLTVVSASGTICVEQGVPVNPIYDWMFDEEDPPYPEFPTTCWAVAIDDNDHDDDGIIDENDNCPTVPNANQADTDSDQRGDACDNCPTVPGSDQTDGDGDGIGNICDNCPTAFNADQADGDGDNVGDICDNCPTVPGSDQTDADGDGLGNICDNCPMVSNIDQTDGDGDNVGDACDNCPAVVGTDQTDTDTDGLGNICDNCPTAYNPNQADSNNNGIGDACEAYIPGDANSDLLINIKDVTFLIYYLYLYGPAPEPPAAGDANCNGQVNIRDITHLINFLYRGGHYPCS